MNMNIYKETDSPKYDTEGTLLEIVIEPLILKALRRQKFLYSIYKYDI